VGLLLKNIIFVNSIYEGINMIVLIYFLIPLIVALIIKVFKIKWIWLTYIFTGGLVMWYPYILFCNAKYLHIIMGFLMWDFFFIFNYILFLPMCLLIQLGLNKHFFNKYY